MCFELWRLFLNLKPVTTLSEVAILHLFVGAEQTDFYNFYLEIIIKYRV